MTSGATASYRGNRLTMVKRGARKGGCRTVATVARKTGLHMCRGFPSSRYPIVTGRTLTAYYPLCDPVAEICRGPTGSKMAGIAGRAGRDMGAGFAGCAAAR